MKKKKKDTLRLLDPRSIYVTVCACLRMTGEKKKRTEKLQEHTHTHTGVFAR